MIMTLKKTKQKKTNLTFFINVYSYNAAQIRICAYIYTLIHKHKFHSSNISVLQITKNPQFQIQFFSSLVLREKKQKQQ